ncbi:DUF4870 domain-containing protein [Candidatus Peregrinibacteria bacterium]|jgi:uncharacterized membrane protein|nr:DUF4870 domain-containing protein [Candidatus Peregrinibacteria bacterium]
MQNISQEIQENFKKENDMTLEEAVQHVEQWLEESNIESAEAGISEIKKFIPDLPELENLEAKLREKKSVSVQKDTHAAEKNSLSSSNLEDVTESERFLSALGYFGFLAVLPLALKPKSEFCQYHGKQALLLALVFTVLASVSVILPGGFGFISILHLVITIYAFMKSYKGKLWNMPMLGDLSRKLPI